MPTLPQTFLGLFVFQFVAALLLYFALAGTSWFVLFVWQRARFFAGEPDDRPQVPKAILWTIVALAGNALLSTPFQYLIAHGHSRVYYRVADHGWEWVAGSALLMLAVTETAIYWIHRALHTRALYRHLHVYHHKFRNPTPWASLAFHPLDSFAQALPHFLCAFLFPVHLAVYVSFVTFVTVWAVLIHDRVSVVRWSAINYTGHHTVHHRFNRDNYGQFFTLWDRLGGTYRHPSALEKGRPAKAA